MIYIIKYIILTIGICIYLGIKAPKGEGINLIDIYRLIGFICIIITYGLLMILFYLNDIDKKIKQ